MDGVLFEIENKDDAVLAMRIEKKVVGNVWIWLGAGASVVIMFAFVVVAVAVWSVHPNSLRVGWLASPCR